jgi:hypothetical protein
MHALLSGHKATRLALAVFVAAVEISTLAAPAGLVHAQQQSPSSVIDPQPACLDNGPADYPVAGGWFYTEAALGCVTQRGPARRAGFAVLDDERANFWTEFRRYGGVDVLGYPISQPYRAPGTARGPWYQAFQRGILVSEESSPPGRAHMAPAMDMLVAAGFEDQLVYMGLPPTGPMDRSLPFPNDAARRMGWLVEPRFLARYFFDPVAFHSSEPDRPGSTAFGFQEQAWDFFGLPSSQAQRMILRASVGGPELWPLMHSFIGQRFQNGGLQLFVENVSTPYEQLTFHDAAGTVLFDPTIVPGDGANGCVALTAVGLIARRIATGVLIPREAVQPLPVVSNPPPALILHIPPVVHGQTLNTFEIDGVNFDPGDTIKIDLGVKTDTREYALSTSLHATAQADGSFQKVIQADVDTYRITVTGTPSGKTSLLDGINLATPTTDLIGNHLTTCSDVGLPLG